MEILDEKLIVDLRRRWTDAVYWLIWPGCDAGTIALESRLDLKTEGRSIVAIFV